MDPEVLGDLVGFHDALECHAPEHNPPFKPCQHISIDAFARACKLPPNAMKLRSYQETALAELFEKLAQRPILCAPTGSGKTVLAAAMIQRLLAEGRRGLFVAHRRELIFQAARRLADFGIKSGIILAGEYARRDLPMQVGSVQTLARRKHPPADFLVIDEAHHSCGDSYQRLFDIYSDCTIVGLTATPFRLDGKGLGGSPERPMFGSIVVAATTRALVESGDLMAPRFFVPARGPDLSDVRTVAGDYEKGALSKVMSGSTIVGDIVRTWKEKAAGLKTLLYAVDIEHSRTLQAAFIDAGIAAKHLDGKTPLEERAVLLEQFARGAYPVLLNCNVLTEGWDLPALEAEIIARPTKSLCLHLQMLGRIMRPFPDKLRPIVLDHAGNVLTHGTPLRELKYSLETKVEPVEAQSDVKQCPACGAAVPRGEPVCPECGHSFAAPRARPEHVAGELQEYQDGVAFARPPLDVRQRIWDKYEQARLLRGYERGWTFHRYKNDGAGMHDPNPCIVYGEDGVGKLVDPAAVKGDDRRRVFEDLQSKARTRGYKPGWAAHMFKRLTGQWPPWGWVTKEDEANANKVAT